MDLVMNMCSHKTFKDELSACNSTKYNKKWKQQINLKFWAKNSVRISGISQKLLKEKVIFHAN